MRYIASNAGAEGSIVVQRVRDLKTNEGYDYVSGLRRSHRLLAQHFGGRLPVEGYAGTEQWRAVCILEAEGVRLRGREMHLERRSLRAPSVFNRNAGCQLAVDIEPKCFLVATGIAVRPFDIKRVIAWTRRRQGSAPSYGERRTGNVRGRRG